MLYRCFLRVTKVLFPIVENKEEKEPEPVAQPKERRSSWLGRSLRKISSPSKQTSVDEAPEKPRRERRRSLLWRLGRDSKAAESSDVFDGERAKTEPTEAAAAGELPNNKKLEEKAKSSEQKGISGYLRRSSSRRKRSQSRECYLIVNILSRNLLLSQLWFQVVQLLPKSDI